MIAWGDGGRGARRTLPAGLNTVMSLKPLPGGDLLVASQDPWLGVLRSDGTPRWTLPPLQMDARGQERNLAVSADGTVVDFGLKFGGDDRRPVRCRRPCAFPQPAGGWPDTAPKQDGLEITDWEDSDAPLLGGKPLPLDPYERSRSLAIHPDGKRFLLGADWSLRAFDADGTELWQRAVPGAVWAVNISGDGRLAVAAYGDGTIRWHRMDDGSELLALFPFADGRNWIAWEPDGRFASTLGARGALRWVVNRGWDEAPLELEAGEVPLSYRPEVIRRVLPHDGHAGGGLCRRRGRTGRGLPQADRRHRARGPASCPDRRRRRLRRGRATSAAGLRRAGCRRRRRRAVRPGRLAVPAGLPDDAARQEVKTDRYSSGTSAISASA